MSRCSYMCVDEEIDCPVVKIAVAVATPSALIGRGRGISLVSALPSQRTAVLLVRAWMGSTTGTIGVHCRV